MKYTKTLAVSLLALLLLASTALAGNVTLGWTQYTNTASADQIKVYGAPGSNVVFTANNANATVTATTSSTNSLITVSNLTAGPWTFTCTARSSVLGLESDNSNVVWTNVPIRGVVNLHIDASVP